MDIQTQIYILSGVAGAFLILAFLITFYLLVQVSRIREGSTLKRKKRTTILEPVPKSTNSPQPSQSTANKTAGFGMGNLGKSAGARETFGEIGNLAEEELNSEMVSSGMDLGSGLIENDQISGFLQNEQAKELAGLAFQQGMQRFRNQQMGSSMHEASPLASPSYINQSNSQFQRQYSGHQKVAQWQRQEKSVQPSLPQDVSTTPWKRQESWQKKKVPIEKTMYESNAKDYF